MPKSLGLPELIRLLTIIEATTVSGPAKLLLDFWRDSRDLQPQVVISVATFVRGVRGAVASNQFLDACSAQGIEVHRIYERCAFDPRVLERLRHLSRELAPHMVETHGTKSHFLMRLSGVWRTRCWVAFHHGYTMDAKRTQVYNQFDRWSLRAPSAIVTVCEPFRWQLAHRGVPAPRITVLHNGISPQWLDENGTCNETTPTGLPRRIGERFVLAVGRLSKEKGVSDLISAMYHLQANRPMPVRLVILGDGPEKQSLRHAVRSLGLEDRVEFLGHIVDVRPYFRIADAIVISSASEGEPLVLLEAMAAGVPIVTTAVGGIPEIVADRQTGLVVPPRNPRALAAAIAEVLQNEALSRAMAEAAQREVRLYRSSEIRARRLVRFYTRLYGNRCAEAEDRPATVT